jgi:alcohol oxidase
MKERSKGGVVDSKLNVYRTQGLKVADLSMVLENVGANTNNTVLVVGEKAALIIGGELGIEISVGWDELKCWVFYIALALI